MFSIAIYILFFGLYVGSAFPVDFNSTISEESPNQFDSLTKTYTFVNNNPQKILKKNILHKEVQQELKMFDTMKEELHFARHKNFEKQIRSKNIAIFKRNVSPATPSAESPETSSAVSPSTTSKIPIDLEKRIEARFQKEKFLIPKTHHKLLRDSIRHEEENKDLRNLVTNLNSSLILKEDELSLLRPYLSIRKWIEKHEALLAPEFRDPKAVFKNMDTQMDFHEAKWVKILKKKNDPIVKQLIRLLDAAKIPHDVFCRRVGGFFLVASGGIHVPSLKKYSTTEMETYLREEFEINDEFTIRSVTEVIMKM